MDVQLSAVDTFAQLLRTVLLAGAAVVAAVATLDWAVRTRRINPFNGVARFMRGRVEPRLAGIERQVLRAGGRPSTTPWWALFAYIVLALLIMAVVDFVLSMIATAVVAANAGAGGILFLVVHWTFGFLMLALMIRVIGSWFPRLATSRWTSWSFGATEWMLRPIRSLVPAFGPLDISPIVAYFALRLLQWIVESALGAAL